jgi:hypothetical protein
VTERAAAARSFRFRPFGAICLHDTGPSLVCRRPEYDATSMAEAKTAVFRGDIILKGSGLIAAFSASVPGLMA